MNSRYFVYDSKSIDFAAAFGIALHVLAGSNLFGSMQALSCLIFLFGVVNRINTTLSNQILIKRENCILRAVGLTGRQLCRMNLIEGMCYAFFAALSVLVVGLPLSFVICAEVRKKSFADTVVPNQFSILEMGLFLLVLFSTEVLLSAWTVRRQTEAVPGGEDEGVTK